MTLIADTRPTTLAERLAEALLRTTAGAPPATSHVAVTLELDGQLQTVHDWLAAGLEEDETVAAWLPSDEDSLVGIGRAWSVPLTGPRRFAAAADRWTMLQRTVMLGGPARDRVGAGPLLLGGAPFGATSGHHDRCWEGFEEGRLELPAIIIRGTPDATLLTATLELREPGQGIDDLVALADRLETRIRGPRQGAAGTAPRLRIRAQVPERDAWCAAVARAAGAVGRGRLDKVVLARRVDLEADRSLDVLGILDRLDGPADADLAPWTRFAFRRGDRTFLGVSPECLVASDGRRMRTVALAGTAPRGADAIQDTRLGASLLGSEKDREEHAVVVDMLRATLADRVDGLELPALPGVVRLPTVQHLATPVTGALRPDTGLLDLVDLLHPTPAVGGWPRAAALELIDEQEGFDRGWYAGPVGWIDGLGAGRFQVAIRSCVVSGTRASAFAGCGIVGDSDPDREWAESTLKMGISLAALGELAS